MCAVYAFMRRADDIADDESMPIEARRTVMSTWLEAWHAAQSGSPTNDPVFIALRDTQQRFNISNDLLDQLVQGTTMDLYPNEFASETNPNLRNLRSALPLLLPRRLRRRPRLHPHLRLHRPPRRETRRRDRHRLPAHQHPPRRKRRRRTQPHLPPARSAT